MSRIRLVVLLVVLSGCGIQRGLLPARTAEDERLARAVMIVRDEWGVPHIHAPTDAAAAFGAAYAQAEDGYAALEERYIHALGRAAYWYGERYLAADLARALFEVERLAREEYAREPADRRRIWDAWAAGMNYYRRTAGVQPRVITLWEPWMPFALVREVGAGTVIDDVALGTISSWDHGTGSVHLLGTRGPAAAAARPDEDTGAWRQPHGAAAWAVAASRTADGHALLLESGTTGYEILIDSDEGWRVRGRTAHGTPVPRSGHNGRVAWAHTGGGTAGSMVEVVFDDPSDPLRYRDADGWHTGTQWQDTILVNTMAGVAPYVATFVRTRHGPVVAVHDGRALAARITGHEEGGSLQQWLALNRTQAVAGVRAVLDGAASATGLMTVAADMHGDIVLIANGVAAAAPAAGWVQSTGTGAAGPDAAAEWGAAARERAGRRLLERDDPWTFAAMAAAAFDTFVPDAASQVAALVLEWEEVGGRNPGRAMRLDAALDALRAWDGNGAVGSEATSLFVLWQERFRAGAYDGAYARFRAMEDALQLLELDHGSALVQWGALNRIVRPGASAGSSPDVTVAGAPADDASAGFASAGAPAWTGMMHRVDSRPAGSRRQVFGDLFVTVTELAPRVRSGSVSLFGQSYDPASAHFSDQAAFYARGEPRDAPFERADVLQRARHAYRPGQARTVR
jgi:acyl-homoserine-lactone acylase